MIVFFYDNEKIAKILKGAIQNMRVADVTINKCNIP